MITAEEKKKIVEVFGFRYSKPLIAKFEAAGIKTRTGIKFSPQGIRELVNAESENEEAELAILTFTREEKKRKEELAKVRKELIK